MYKYINVYMCVLQLKHWILLISAKSGEFALKGLNVTETTAIFSWCLQWSYVIYRHDILQGKTRVLCPEFSQ